MSSPIECFWLEPVEMARSTLRRYERHPYDSPPSCPQNRMRYHDTSVYLGNVPYPFGPRELLGEGGNISHDDTRWPKACETCGVSFRDEDYWQHNLDRLFKGAPDGQLYTTRNMPPGSLFDASWWPEKGPDGRCLAVVLPPLGGDDIWIVDAEGKAGSRWTRSGAVPKVTVTPSILTPRYHGFLTNGCLVSC